MRPLLREFDSAISRYSDAVQVRTYLEQNAGSLLDTSNSPSRIGVCKIEQLLLCQVSEVNA